MKNTKFYSAIFISLFLLGALSTVGSAAVCDEGMEGECGDPGSVQIKIYAMWVSSSSDCSEPIEVFNNPSADFAEFWGLTPTFGSGSIPNGTYPCIIFKMNDQIKAVAGSNWGACNSVDTVNMDIFRGDEGMGADLSVCPDIEGSITGAGTMQAPSYQTTCVYFTTGSNNDPEGHGFRPDADEAIQIPAAFVVSSDVQATFVMNFHNRMRSYDFGGGPACWLEGPTMEFR